MTAKSELERLMIAKDELERLRGVDDALTAFIEVWQHNDMDYTTLACVEVESLAKLFKVSGLPIIADGIVEDHATGDDEPSDMHYKGTDGTYVHPASPEAIEPRKFNNHSDDSGNWCRWSTCTVGDKYSDCRCPAGCRASSIEGE